MTTELPRTKLAIITELHELTKMMFDNCEESDFLILSVEKRQDLMDEYDALDLYHRDQAAPTENEQKKIKELAQETIKLDSTINDALNKHKIASKESLATNTAKQKIMGYTNQALSSSGSYMDYKK